MNNDEFDITNIHSQIRISLCAQYTLAHPRRSTRSGWVCTQERSARSGFQHLDMAGPPTFGRNILSLKANSGWNGSPVS